MRAKLTGFRRVDMEASAGSNAVHGYSCYFLYPESGVTGLVAEKRFVSDEICSGCQFVPQADTDVTIDFTPKGRVGWIEKISDGKSK